MYLYGASGHAKVIIEILERNGVSIDGLFDDDPLKIALLSYPVMPFTGKMEPGTRVIISIGDNRIRKNVSERMVCAFGNAIHPFTSISTRSTIEEGSVVMAGVCINSDTAIGRHVIINTNASVDHDCRIGSFVHVAPGAVLCGDVSVGDGSLVGAGAVVLPGISIGKGCTIGAGSVVTRSLPDYSRVAGNPCRDITREASKL